VNGLRLVLRGAQHHWRTQSGVVAGATIAAAVLIGALVLGDSVRGSLRHQAMMRIGDVGAVLVGGDRFFLDDLGDRITGDAPRRAAPIVAARGIASTTDGAKVAREVDVLGVDERFFDLAPGEVLAPVIAPGQALLSPSLARQLDAAPGQTIIIRIEKPTALPKDAVFGSIDEISLALRVTVAGIATDGQFARFGLSANQTPPSNLFVPLDWLQEQLELSGRANLLLATDADVALLASALEVELTPSDVQLVVEQTPVEGVSDLRSDRILMMEAEYGALAGEPADGVFTYFVNTLASGDHETPYSMVSAIGPLNAGTKTVTPTGSIIEDLSTGEIVINQWLADDLDIGSGDALTLTYFILDDTDALTEASSSFTVKRVIPIEGAAADETLMPEFPGIADAESSSDWEPGIPIDLGRIRDKDETYWEEHRGTPKAFVTLEDGREMWASRYGDLTGVRFPAERILGVHASLRTLNPRDLGLLFRNVREPALNASQATTDFGGLFLALSFFLVLSALLLTSMLFVFNVEIRAREIGAELAIGLPRRLVRRLLLMEGAAFAFIGGIAGIPLGVAYTALVLRMLSGVWSNAVASAAIDLYVNPGTIVLGAAIACCAAILAMLLSAGRLMKRSPVALLSGETVDHQLGRRPHRWPLVLSAIAMVGALVLALSSSPTRQGAAGVFFGAGALLLVAGLCAVAVWSARLKRSGSAGARGAALQSMSELGIRSAARRAGRSISTITLIACGVFLIVGVSVHQFDPVAGSDDPTSGTGGFTLYGESSIPVFVSLNEQRGRHTFGITDEDLEGVRILEMSVRAGDEASCLNLNRPQQPRLVGVDPTDFDGRFTFVKSLAGEAPGWSLLTLPGGPIPAIADDASATWAMHKSIGDTIEYTDGSGDTFQVRIVGTIATSILQGNLIIAKDRFKQLYPREQGSRMFLIDIAQDTAPQRADEVATALTRAMSDIGLALTPAKQRLADFSAVQNTYLTIFQMLGALGLLLGTVGLGVVVVRNALERRKELAILRVLGLRRSLIRRVILIEHVLILILGLALGALAALLAVIPSLASGTQGFPAGFTALLLAGIALSGLFWIWLATRLALAGSTTRALAQE